MIAKAFCEPNQDRAKTTVRFSYNSGTMTSGTQTTGGYKFIGGAIGFSQKTYYEMRVIAAEEITRNVREMCIEANVNLSEDMEKAVRDSVESEDSPLGKQILGQLCENLDIAKENDIPICQETGMAVFFVKVGQDVHIEGMNITDAINEGVRQGYTDGYLRKSVVKDPLIRENTKDNTPAIIHYDIVPGDKIEITIAPKGFGSENMSKVYMLKPADGEEGVKAAVLQAVKESLEYIIDALGHGIEIMTGEAGNCARK